MDTYGLSTTAQDLFRIEDLLDLSNDEIFSSSANNTTTTVTNDINQLPPPQNPCTDYHSSLSTDFTDDLCVSTDDVAELEWLSQFVDDSFTDFPKSSIAGTLTVPLGASGGGPSKCSKATNSAVNPTTWNWTSSEKGNSKAKRETNLQSSPTPDCGVRRCSHCASEKTPQWRTGPLGPKTLCNACGVRYKSGRLVPEYRPAVSPTFVLTQHSNSHRKVLELRRQKELLRQRQQQQQLQSPGTIYRTSVTLKHADLA